MIILTEECIFPGYDPPTPDGVVIRTPPGESLISPLWVDNLPWTLFKREIESQVISQRYLIETQGQYLDSGGPNAREFNVCNDSQLTTLQSPTTPSATIYPFDQTNLSTADQLNTDLWDWTILNDLTYSSLFGTVSSSAFPETNQLGLGPNPSDAVAISTQPALSLLSELAQRNTTDLPSFLKRYTINEQDLKLDESMLIPTDQAALFHFFSSFIFLITNNILTEHDIHQFFTWVVHNSCTWIVAKLLEITPTVTGDVFANKIFPAAIRTCETEFVRKLITRGVDVHCQNKWWTPLSFAVQRRDMEMVSLLCECGLKPEILHFSILKSEENNDTLWSTRNNNLLSLLLALGADSESFIRDEPSGYPLVSAAAEGEVGAVQLLLGAKARTDLAIPELGTALQAAAALGHKAVVRLLIEAGANVNATWDFTKSHRISLPFLAVFMTPIQLAARGNRGEIVQLMIQSGALVNYCPVIPHFGLYTIEELFSEFSRRGSDDEFLLAYPIQHAAANNNMALVQQLIAAGANADSRIGTNYGDTPLQIAARMGNIAMAEMLLSYNADVNAPPGKYDGRTAIQAAAGNGNIDMMQMLLSAGADINAAAGWRKGRTVIQAAMEKGHHDLIALSLHRGADINAKSSYSGGLTALQAAASCNIELLKTALANGADVKGAVSPEDGVTALQAVIRRKDISSLNILLDTSLDVNELSPLKPSDSFRSLQILCPEMTSLQHAARLEWTEGAKLLIDFGAEIDALPSQPGIYALTALGWAIDNYDYDMMELLLHRGADPNAPSINFGEAPTAFLFALDRCCSDEIFDLFLQRGADITKCWESKSAMEVAISSTTNDISVVKKVVDTFSQLAGGSYSTVSQRALACITVDKDEPPDLDLVKILLDAGANVDAVDTDTGETLLQKTLIEPDVGVIKLLLESGAEVNFLATEDRGTPLQTAILYEEPEIANLLMDYGANINALPAGNRGATALQAAAIYGYIELARRLLEHGADVAAAAAPVNGRTAIDGAAEHGRLDMLQLLLNSYPYTETLPIVCKRAASFAEKEGHSRVAAFLRTYTSC